MSDDYQISNNEQLRAVIGDRNEQAAHKVVASLDESMRQFIGQSPLIFISTIDEAGQFDVSPKGDAAGFVHVDENGDLLIPDRPGNKLVMGFENIIRNNNVGLIFLIPNTRETLRVKGTASLNNDPELLQRLAAKDKPAILCTKVAVNECFFHCGKAMIRSGAWKPESWPERDKALMAKSIAKRFSAAEEDISASLEQSYKDRLY